MKKNKQLMRNIKLERLKQEMGGTCLTCGITDSRVLQLHHTDARVNSGQPGWDVVRDWSYDRLRANYTENCVLVCANCHLIYHHKQRNKDG